MSAHPADSWNPPLAHAPVEDAPTWQEELCADDQTVKARRWISDVLAALPSVMAYLREQHGAALAARYGEAEAAEIWRDAEEAYRALIDAARRADTSRSLVRRFSLPGWKAEAFRRRARIDRGLPEEEEKRQKDTLARAWRRTGWSAIHRLQRVTRLGFFEREVVEFHANRERKSSVYTDNLTDVLIGVLRLVRRRGMEKPYDVGSFHRAAGKVVEEFRAERDPYAPEWDAHAEGEGSKAAAKPKASGGATATARAERVIVRAVETVAAIAATLPPEEADALGLLLLERMGESWRQACARPLLVRPVLPMADSPFEGGEECAKTRTGFCENPAKSDESAGLTADIQSAVGVPGLEVVDFDPEPEPRGVSLAEAEAAVEAFASVGVERYKVVFVDDTKGREAANSCTLAEDGSLDDLRLRLLSYLERNARSDAESMTVRLHFKGDTRLLQLDDCGPEVMQALTSFCFLRFATSPGNGQMWLALVDDLGEEQYLDLRHRLLAKLKPTGANGGPYGASRWPGSLNRKPKRRYADGESPRVQLLGVAYGRRVAVAELEAAGLLAPPRPRPSLAEVRAIKARIPDGWPDLDYFLARKGNRSDAEMAWCVRSLSLGWPPSHVEAELARIGEKARVRRRDNYVRETVDKAARWLALDAAPSSHPSHPN